jgi:hypothetical protein
MNSQPISMLRNCAAGIAALIACGMAPPALAMDEAQMQQMMEQAQKMQTCMADLDRVALEEMKQESDALMSEVKALCDAGERDEAQDKAIAWGKKIARSDQMQQMKKCGEMMQGVMPMQPPTPDELAARGHICDQQ